LIFNKKQPFRAVQQQHLP